MTKATTTANPEAGRETGDGATTNRRQLLKRIGLLAGAVYAAPVLLQLSDAHAGKGSGKGGGGGGKGSGRGRGRGKGSGKKGSGKKGSGKKGSGKKGSGRGSVGSVGSVD
jgi:hypothetical protein